MDNNQDIFLMLPCKAKSSRMHLPIMFEVSVISGKPEVHSIISQWEKTFQKCSPPDFKFYHNKKIPHVV